MIKKVVFTFNKLNKEVEDESNSELKLFFLYVRIVFFVL